jgi:hypothetical protein
MVDCDEDEDNKSEASKNRRRIEAELFGDSFEDDELNDNSCASDESSNDDNSNSGDEDDNTEKDEEESSNDDETVENDGEKRDSGSQNVPTQVATRTFTSDTSTEQVLGHTAERVEIRSAGKTTKITNKSSDDAERVKNQSVGKTTQITNKSSDNAERVEIQSVGKTTEITNKSSDDAERVEIQSAGKTTEITNRSSDDTERVEIQSAGKTTKITNKSSEDVMTYDAMRTSIHEADQATQKLGNWTSDITIIPPVTIEIQPGGKNNEIPASHMGPEMVETQSRGKINEKETSKGVIEHEEQIDQIALDGSIEQRADGQLKIFEHFQNMVHDSILQIHLLYIPLFVHWDDITVAAQPLVNHCALSIQNIKSKDFRRKMQQEGNDFAEEMHAIIYELKKKENGDNLSSVPIYSTYMINPEQSIEHELPNVEAVYPTVQGLI